MLATLWKRFLRERLYLVGLQCSLLQIVMFAIIKIRSGNVFCLVSLGVTDYSWEIVGMDFVTEFTKGSEFHSNTILDLCLPCDMAHFLTRHKKSPLTKLWFSLLIIVLDFMVFHKSLCLIDTLPCWQNSAIFDEEIEYQTHYECSKTSSNRWPYWTCWVECANSFALLLIWISFLIGYLIYPWLIFLLQFFNQWKFGKFKVSNKYLLTDYLIDYG